MSKSAIAVAREDRREARTATQLVPKGFRPSVDITGFVLCLLASSSSLAGQAENRPPAGTRVRVVTSDVASRMVTGTVTEWRADSLLLDVGRRSHLAIPLTALTRLDVSRGTKSKVVTGTGIGMLVGAAAAAAFLGGFCSDPDTLCESDEVLRALAILVPPPAAIGALIGLAIRVERWESVSLPTAGAYRTAWPAMRLGVALGF